MRVGSQSRKGPTPLTLIVVVLRAVLVLASLAIACGDSGAALSGGVSPAPLLTPTPIPPVATAECGTLPTPKCEIERRMEQDRLEAERRWQALAITRTYVPIPGIPFVDSSPRPTLPPRTPSPSPEPAIRSCTAADLAGALGGTNGAGGRLMWALVIANTSDSVCGLKGSPAVRILAGSRLNPATYAKPAPDVGHLVMLIPGRGAPNTLNAIQGQAFTWVTWGRGCTSVWLGATTLVLDLPRGGGALEIKLPASGTPGEPTPVASAECPGDAPYHPSVGAWEFQPRVDTPPANPVSLPRINAAANWPGIAVAGETFAFEVTLTNGEGESIRFAECPNFRMWISAGLDRKIVDERHELNCAAAPQLPAGGSRTFEMRINVPADWPVSRAGSFGWGLEAYPGAVIKLPLIIARRA